MLVLADTVRLLAELALKSGGEEEKREKEEQYIKSGRHLSRTQKPAVSVIVVNTMRRMNLIWRKSLKENSTV